VSGASVIPRYIDSPPQLLWWELDEVIVLIICVFAGMLARELTAFLVVGVLSTVLIGRMKRGKSDGIVYHWCYWLCLPGFSLPGYPPGDQREFLE
jgi:conjugal transfer pilus assembly protein TraL